MRRMLGMAILSGLAMGGTERAAGASALVPDNAFPACIQFSPVPSGKGWKGEKPPLPAAVREDTLRNLIEHGFNVLYYPVGGLSETEGQEVLAAAEALGMKVNYMTGGFEMFRPGASSGHQRLFAPLRGGGQQAGRGGSGADESDPADL